jgi:fatty-acyl-CoA synthase
VNFGRVWERIAEIDPERVAIISGDRQRTFADLDARASRLAGFLRAQGLVAGDSVGLLLHNRVEYLEAFFAATKLGCTPFNINYRYRGREIAYLLDDADAKALFYERSLRAEVDVALEEAASTPTLVECGADPNDTLPVGAVAFDEAVARATPLERHREPSGQDLMYLYTGGTTGMPKAVMWRHEDLYDALRELSHPGRAVPDPLAAITAGKRALTALPASPLMHGTALFIALQTLAGGGTVVICEGAGFDAKAAITAMRRHDVQLLSIVGDAFAHPLLDALAQDPADLPSLQVVVSSGVQWSLAAKEALLQRLPQLRLIDSLGASEGPASQAISTKDSVGQPARFKAGGRVRVIDDLGNDIEPGSGEVGMLAMVGPGPIGYLGEPEKSAATFRELGGRRMTVPGDHATIELDGTITFLGRGSACVNTGGEKVFPEEVESVLRAHPDVYDCAIVGVPDPRWGERVVALVHARGDSSADLRAELDAACLEQLAPYKRPRDYLIWDSLERSAAGKVDLAALRQRAIKELAT